MDDLGSRGTNFHGPYPFVLCQSRIDDDVLVGHHSRGLDLLRFRQLDNVIRLSNPPSLGEFLGNGGVFRVSSRLALRQPGLQVFLFRFRQGSIIGPRAWFAFCGVCGEPRWHDTTFHRQTNWGGLSDDIVVGIQCKGSRTSRCDGTPGIATA